MNIMEETIKESDGRKTIRETLDVINRCEKQSENQYIERTLWKKQSENQME